MNIVLAARGLAGFAVAATRHLLGRTLHFMFILAHAGIQLLHMSTTVQSVKEEGFQNPSTSFSHCVRVAMKIALAARGLAGFAVAATRHLLGRTLHFMFILAHAGIQLLHMSTAVQSVQEEGFQNPSEMV